MSVVPRYVLLTGIKSTTSFGQATIHWLLRLHMSTTLFLIGRANEVSDGFKLDSTEIRVRNKNQNSPRILSGDFYFYCVQTNHSLWVPYLFRPKEKRLGREQNKPTATSAACLLGSEVSWFIDSNTSGRNGCFIAVTFLGAEPLASLQTLLLV